MAQGLRRAHAPRARAGRSKACRSASRTCSAPRACAPRPASHILDGFVPPYESTVTANLWRDGAVMLGKLNMDEFAMGSSNETSLFGTGRQSRGARRNGVATRTLVPGGSSGGSAAAVAARLCAGGDRRPTPAARSASRRPSPAPSASSRPMAAARAGASSPSPPRSTRPGRSRATVRDAAIMLRSMAGHDPKDTTSVDLRRAGFRGGASAGRSRA